MGLKLSRPIRTAENTNLSLVIATVNRLQSLQRTIDSVMQHAEQAELIVVDGGSTDGTIEWLRTIDLDHVILQGKKLGAIAAYNAGFSLSRREYVAWLNDDSVLLNNCLQYAIVMMQRAPQIGQVAIPFSSGDRKNGQLDHVRLAGKKWLYANFGVTRKILGDKVGWWGTSHFFYAGDTELSMKIWNLGYRVEPLGFRGIHHHEVRDEERQTKNVDSQDFYAKWRGTWKGPGDANPLFAR